MLLKSIVFVSLFSNVFSLSLRSLNEFSDFMTKYNKTYTPTELIKRYRIFDSNLKTIYEHNNGKYSWKMDINRWTDLTWDEFKSTHLGLFGEQKNGIIKQKFDSTDYYTLPNSVDWRNKNVVNQVKNQEQCGSCWAFSAISSIESAVAIKTGKLYSLSEQQLVDCSTTYGNEGCSGGLMDDAFSYAENNKLCTEQSYQYTASDGNCKKCNGVVSVKGYVDVQSGNETALRVAVAQQPVSVAIEADQYGFQFYSSGVFDGDCGQNLDHGVVVVGYGTDTGKDFWLVRNSWGSDWGESGYIRLVRGKNQCGIALEPSYPVV